MKYAVAKNVNGTFGFVTEWDNNLPGARMSFWDTCKIHESAPDVNRAVIALVNENFDIVEDKKEIIEHAVEPQE